MSLDDETIVPTLEGTTWLQSPNEDFVATTPGHSTVRWDVPGVIARTLDLEVAKPEDGLAIEVLARKPESKEPETSVDFDALPPLAASEAPPMARLDLASSRNLYFTYETRIVLADGRRALGPLDAIAVTPAIFATAQLDTFKAWAFAITTAPAIGEGTLTLRSAGLSASVPLSVGPPVGQ